MIDDSSDRFFDGSGATFFGGVDQALSEGGVVFDGSNGAACLGEVVIMGIVAFELIEQRFDLLGGLRGFLGDADLIEFVILNSA
jgi:hypothetical protein